jgi:hypothetical protein
MKKSAIRVLVLLGTVYLCAAESKKEVCRNTLLILETAKQMWALENRKTLADTPLLHELRPHLPRPGWSPMCPHGGSYEIGAVESDARCSVHQTARDIQIDDKLDVESASSPPAPDNWRDRLIDLANNHPLPIFGGFVVIVGIIFGVGFYNSSKREPANPFEQSSQGVSPATWFPWLLILGGGGLAIYFFTFFDTSVPVPGGTILGIDRVNNLGLMNQRQNGILIGIGGAILGAILLLVFKRR